MKRQGGLKVAALLVVAMLAVAACGTSQTAQVTPSPSPTPTPGPTPAPSFSVVRTTPANGATEVGLGTNIVIEFNMPVNNQPGNGLNPCVAGIVITPAPIAGPAPANCVVVGNTVTWTNLVFRGTTTYTVTVPAQVGSQTGVILGSNYTFTFTTRTGQLTNAVLPVIPGSVGWACAPDNTGTVVGGTAWVGDDEAGGVPAVACVGGGGALTPRFRGFVAFNLLPQMLNPPAAVQNATLTVSAAAVIGNIFDVFLGGGPIRVTRVDYLDNGVLDQADYAMGPVGQLLNVFDSSNFVAPAMVDVTGYVQTALGTPPTTIPGQTPYVGFRFQWGTACLGVENTDCGADDDAVRLEGFVLQVTYWH
jgi:hypothetical protein